MFSLPAYALSVVHFEGPVLSFSFMYGVFIIVIFVFGHIIKKKKKKHTAGDSVAAGKIKKKMKGDLYICII